MVASRFKCLGQFFVICLVNLIIGMNAALAAEVNSPRAYFEPRFFESPILHVDGEEYEREFLEIGYSSAAHAFASNPEAAKYFNNYLKDVKTYNYLIWGTLGTFVTFSVLNKKQWHLPRQEADLISNGIFIGGLSSAIYFLVSGSYNLPKALNIYNGIETAQKSGSSPGDVMIEPVIIRSDSDLTLATGGGLAFKFAF